MSYPDLIEQDGRYWITETNKVQALSHEIDSDFFNNLWNQFYIRRISTKGLAIHVTGGNLINKEFKLPSIQEPSKGEGFTVNMLATIKMLKEGTMIFENRDVDKGFWLEMSAHNAVKFTMTDGVKTSSWTSDTGVVKFIGPTEISLIVDYRSKVISYVINGKFNDGGKERVFGWGQLDNTMDAIGTNKIKIGDIARGGGLSAKNRVKAFRFYNRPLTISECIGNYRQNH
jgi:hypothetical protein